VTDYILLFRGGDPENAGLSPEEIQALMGRWRTWIQSLRDEGIFRAGEPLEDEGKVITADRTIQDGPFLESKELVGGFVILGADSLEDAAQIALECPILESQGQVEVRPVRDLVARTMPEGDG
jgi:hypothetical protein